MNSMGISIWEGELEDSMPTLSGNISDVSHLAADIYSGIPLFYLERILAFCLMPFSPDVKSSPDFGLAVLGICAPGIAYYPWDDAKDKDGRPPITFALLPWILFFAQWGLLLSVFSQSVADCKETLLISSVPSFHKLTQRRGEFKI
jgi:hypothetical protein